MPQKPHDEKRLSIQEHFGKKHMHQKHVPKKHASKNVC